MHSPRVEEGIFAYDYFEFIARHITILLSALLLLIFSAVLYTPIASSFNQAELPQDPITEISASTQEPIRDTPSSKSTPNSVSTPTIVLSATPVPTANALETRRAVELTRTAMPESSATVEGFDINTFNARNTRQASETKQAATEQAIKVEETPTHILPTQTNVEATCSVATGPRWGPTLWNQYKDRLSCPLSQEIRTGGAFQIYQRGITIWRQDADRIYILYSNGTYASYSDDSPAGYSVSNMVKGGFGYLWQNNSTVREGLGEPVTAEANATNFAAQDFASGTILYFLENEAFNYVLFADNHRWTSTQD